MRAKKPLPGLNDQRDIFPVLRYYDGYYVQPEDRGGPLVGYAGRYDDGKGNQRQYVGRIYANFAVLERHHDVRAWLCLRLQYMSGEHFSLLKSADSFFGAPMGGVLFAAELAAQMNRPTGYFDKKVIAVATETSREKSKLFFGRHEVEPGEKVILVEDVCNNFSTTGEAYRLIQQQSAELIAVVCMFNRSNKNVLGPEELGQDATPIPVLSVAWRDTPQYRQDDPAVADEIARGHVIWKAKEQWDKLMEFMPKY